MQPFADTIALGVPHFGFAVLDAFNMQVELILMIFRPPVELCSPVGQYSQQWYLLIFEEGQHPIVEDISRCNGMLAGIQFGKGHPAIGIDKGLLINTSNTLDRTHIVGVVGTQVARMLGLYFSMGLQLLFFAFQGDYLGFG